MKIILKNNDLNEALSNVTNLGFVPTMGGLHKGHISLIQKSQKRADKTLVSLFIKFLGCRDPRCKHEYLDSPRCIRWFI